MSEAIGGGESEFQRHGIGNAGAIQIGRYEVLLVGQRFDLRGGPMRDHDPDIERTEDRDIQEDVWKILVGDNRAIDADDERLLPEARDILQDAPQVSRFHFLFVWSDSRSACPRLISRRFSTTFNFYLRRREISVIRREAFASPGEVSIDASGGHRGWTES